MALELARIIYFTGKMDALTTFYRDVLGLDLIRDEAGWKEFRAGGCIIALHKGAAAKPSRGPKIAFYASDVATTVAELTARGAAMGKLQQSPDVTFCDGQDLDGNVFSISNRQ